MVKEVKRSYITEEKIIAAIKEVTRDYKHVLDCGPASVEINSPRALMQVSAIAKLDMLHMFINKKRPKFAYDTAEVDT